MKRESSKPVEHESINVNAIQHLSYTDIDSKSSPERTPPLLNFRDSSRNGPLEVIVHI